MSDHRRTHSPDSAAVNAGQFSADQFREAMGPGYSVALFRDQPMLTGHLTPTPPSDKPSRRKRTRRPLLRVPSPRRRRRTSRTPAVFRRSLR